MHYLGGTPAEVAEILPHNSDDSCVVSSRFLPSINVHEKVPKSRYGEPGAQAALDKEWQKLLDAPWPNGKGRGCWDYSIVRELQDVRAEAKRTGQRIHLVRMHELLTEKNAELPKGDPARKFKGRCVLLGNVVKDENGMQQSSARPHHPLRPLRQHAL